MKFNKEIFQGHWFQTFLSATILLGLTTVIFLYTSGYRLTRNQNDVNIDLKRTGLISAKSIPDGANVYINGVLYTATDATIPALDPGQYNLKIVKNGFVPWEKDVEVFAELVTDITAVLVSQTPRLEPLTNTGARVPVVSPTLSQLAYFSKDGQESGIWIIPLNKGGISLFRSAPYVAIEDTAQTIYSNGESIEWSPDEDMLLVKAQNENYFVVDINAKTTQSTTAPELLRASWEQEKTLKRKDFLKEVTVPQDIYDIAVNPNTIWAPDEKKFLYEIETDTTHEYRVYNLEKPLPIGEKVDNVVISVNKEDPKPILTWYADSFHLVMVEGDIEATKRGTISLIRIDGSNKTEIFNNNIYDENVYSTPGGDKLIFLTSFRSNEQTDLYTIGIR